MTIQRLYEPDPEALERVVEILYRLLVESPQSGVERAESSTAGAPEPTCLSTEAE
jgi:hypothetical protein